jgi:hypothetical protein
LTLLLPLPSYLPRPFHYSRCDHLKNVGWGVQIIKLHLMYFYPFPCYLFHQRPN